MIENYKVKSQYIDLDLSQVVKELGDRCADVTDCIRDHVYQDAPVKSGYLKSTIYSKIDGDTGEVGVTADYAGYTEIRGSSAGWFSTAVAAAMNECSKIWQDGD